jgi:phage terminase large subunit
VAQLGLSQAISPIPGFHPKDWQWAPFLDRSKVMLLSGKPGGGKSFLAANKIHGFLLQYPGATAVVARKVEEDMDQGTINLFLDTVINIDHEPRCRYQARKNRVVYEHPDGQYSELLFKGMNTARQREGWKSLGQKGDADIIWLEEATEFEEEDFNYVLTRTRGRAAGWSQIILTCNPDAHMHWIHTRLIMGGEATYYYSDWTMNDEIDQEDYTATMNMTTGITRARMWEGDWTDGIGKVIDTWEDRYHKVSNPNPLSGNVVRQADYIPGGGPVVWVADDGYAGTRGKTGFFTADSNPRVFLMGQKRPNDQLAIFHEDFEVRMMYGPHIAQVLDVSMANKWPPPIYVVYDGASPTLGRYLTEFGLNAIPFRTKIESGNDELRSWVGADENGMRRLIVSPDLEHTRWEFRSYVYDPRKKNTPIDAFNHAIDALRYLTTFISFGEPLPADVAAPGVDMDEIFEAVRKALAAANEEFEKKYSDYLRKAGIRG